MSADRPPSADDERLARAWALKEQCFSTWNSEPAHAAQAAQALRALCASEAGEPTPLDREVAALANWTEGIAELTRAQMSAAVRCFDRACEGFRALGQPGPAAQTQVPKIMALSMLGLHAEAAASGESTQAALLAAGDLKGAGKVSLNLGSLQLRQDAYPQAVRHYRDAAVLFARVGDPQLSVMADGGLADALTAMGDFDAALRHYHRARLSAAQHALPVVEAVITESIALLDLARGRYREALAGLEASRDCYERLAMPQHLAIAEKQLGDAYLELRLLGEAVGLFDLALQKFEALDMPDEQAWTLAQRGRAQALLGQQAQAGESLTRATQLFATQSNRVGEATVALARAELALAAGQGAAALLLAGQAASAFDAANRADGQVRAERVRAECLLQTGELDAAEVAFDTTLARARELQLLTDQVRCLTGLGHVAGARADEAAARTAFDAAIELFEEQRRALPGDEVRSAFLSDHLLPYQGLLRLALADHERSPSVHAASAVLVQLDRIRARTLSERLAEAPGEADDGATRGQRARLNWLYRRIQRLEDEGERSAAFIDELHRTERELLERARRQRLTAPVGGAERFSDGDFSLDALQRELGSGDALLEYGVLDEELFACIVTRAGVQVHRRLAAWPDVEEALRAARFQFETLRHGSATVLRHLASLTARARQRLQRLHALVWAPMATALQDSQRVLVVPHGALGSLPFGALHDGDQVLAQRHQLALAPSARLALRGLLRKPVPAQRALVLGESSRLAHAASEAQFVAGLFAHSVVCIGEQASLASLQAHAGTADVIHLACHAQFRADNPMFSALHLADAALTVERAEHLRLKPGIVVLSACETGLSEHRSGDEMFGLVRAFLVAGAARVLASQWPVEDATTETFMAHFHGALLQGQAPAKALQLAQIETMRTRAHPFYWAAFTLHGGW